MNDLDGGGGGYGTSGPAPKEQGMPIELKPGDVVHTGGYGTEHAEAHVEPQRMEQFLQKAEQLDAVIGSMLRTKLRYAGGLATYEPIVIGGPNPQRAAMVSQGPDVELEFLVRELVRQLAVASEGLARAEVRMEYAERHLTAVEAPDEAPAEAKVASVHVELKPTARQEVADGD